MNEDVNSAFRVPPELEAALRAKAAQIVAALPEEALLAQYVAEAKAKKLATLREQAAVLAADDPKVSIDAHGFPEEYVELMIYKGHGKDALAYQPFGINGYFWKVQRGARVIVHKVLQHVLDNAIGEEVVQAEGGLITQPVHRFPYQVIRDNVSKADYLAAKAAGKTAAVSQTATATA